MNPSDIETSPRFLPEVEAKLREAGWHPDRLVEEHIMDEWFAIPFDFPPLAGYHLMFPAAYRFIREFGGLTLGRFSEIELVPADVYVDVDTMLGCEWYLESRLYPIGHYPEAPNHYFLIDLGGRVWGMIDNLILIGNDTNEAITNLVTGKWIGTTIALGEMDNTTNCYVCRRVEDAIRAHRKRAAR